MVPEMEEVIQEITGVTSQITRGGPSETEGWKDNTRGSRRNRGAVKVNTEGFPSSSDYFYLL